MYKKVYRQEGGLAEQGYLAQIREAARKKIEEFNRRNKGEVAQRVRTPVRKPSIPQRIKKGISSLVPDTVKNIAALPINVFTALGGGDTGYMSPEMIEATRQAARNAIERTGQDKNVTMDYMDYIGAPDYLDAGRYSGGFPQIFKEGGTGAGAASVTFGGATVNKDPATGEISFTPGSGDYDMSDNNPIWLGGLPGWLGLSDKNPMNVPMESFIDPDYTAAKQLGDIEAQVDPYDQGLASLPEAQADEPWSTTDWDTFVSKRNEDPDTDLQYLGPEVQPTNNPYIGASVNSPMWFGGYPLQSGDTLTAEQMRMNRQGHTKDYRIPPNLKLQYNDDGTGTIVSRPADEMETTPGYTTDNWFKALEYYNPNYREQRTNYFKRDDSNQYIIPAGQNTTDFNLLQNYYQGQQ